MSQPLILHTLTENRYSQKEDQSGQSWPLSPARRRQYHLFGYDSLPLRLPPPRHGDPTGSRSAERSALHRQQPHLLQRDAVDGGAARGGAWRARARRVRGEERRDVEAAMGAWPGSDAHPRAAVGLGGIAGSEIG